MRTVTISEAALGFQVLLGKVARGEEVIITSEVGEPLARWIPEKKQDLKGRVQLVSKIRKTRNSLKSGEKIPVKALIDDRRRF